MNKSRAFWALALIYMLPSIAMADALDDLNLFVAANAQHDSNLFRLSDSANTQALLGTDKKDDVVYVTQVGIKIDKPYSLQRFKIDFTHSNYRYTNFSYLNYAADDYSLAWKWALTPRLTGNISTDRSQTLNSYSDYTTNYQSRNVRTNETRRFDVDGEVSVNWHLLGGMFESKQTNSQFFSADGDYLLFNQEAGIRYLNLSNSSATFFTRTGKGRYTDRVADPLTQLDSHFKQDEQELRLDWELNSYSSLKGSVKHVTRQHTNFSSRNYQGTPVRIDYYLAMTEKTNISVYAGRDLQSYQTLTSSFYRQDSVGILPSWSITTKLKLSANLQSSKRAFDGSLVAVTNNRDDRVRTAGLNLEWQPTRSSTISTTLQSERRTSNTAGFDYSSKTIGLSGKLLF